MRLYPYPDPVPAVDAPEGHFEPAEDGGFDFPDSLFTRLHSTHHNGEKRWETGEEQRKRHHGEESARRRDPETLYNAVAEIANATKGLRQPQELPADMLAEFAALRAEVAELRVAAAAASPAQDAEADGGAPEDESGQDEKPAEDAKPPVRGSRSRSK